RPGHRAFRPALDNRLEPRFLLRTQGPVTFGAPKPHDHRFVFMTAAGGRSVLITTPDNQQFLVSVTSNLNNGSTGVTSGGTVRARALPGGRVGLIVDGTTPESSLTINPVNRFQHKGLAHAFSREQSTQTHLLNVGFINVTSGKIGEIAGYHTAVL